MKTITRYAKENRRKFTRAEQEMKKKLQRWRIKFRTQRMFDYYIVDFLLPERRLVIEVDGAYHNSRQDYDQRRDEYLRGLGLTIVRITNEEVLGSECKFLLTEILTHEEVDISTLPPHLSYGRAKY